MVFELSRVELECVLAHTTITSQQNSASVKILDTTLKFQQLLLIFMPCDIFYDTTWAAENAIVI